MDVQDIADRLEAIADELGDLAFDRLRQATSAVRTSGAPASLRG